MIKSLANGVRGSDGPHQSGATASTSSSSKSSINTISSSKNTNSPKNTVNSSQDDLANEPVYHNTFGTHNYHFIGQNQNNIINSNKDNTNVYSLNGNATTSSNGSSSGYDTLSITTALGAQHLGTDNSNTSSGSSGSNGHMNNNKDNTSNTHLRNQSSSFMIMNNKPDDNVYSDLGRDELNSLMNDAVIAMDLPPDKLKIVKMLPDEKKIQFLRSLRHVSEKQPPEYYIKALTTYIDGISSQKSRKPKLTLNETSTALIKNLEVSLRTNRIDWVHKFLDTPFNGLDVLIMYLENSLNLMREYEQFDMNDIYSNGQATINPTGTLNKNQSLIVAASLERRASRAHKDTRKRMNKLNMGEAIDDVHECVRCLRAIMNHQYGFHMIIGHKEAINSIALSLKHKEYRTKSLVLELLAAVCLVDGGHSIVLRAFDNFKDTNKEMYRFETLMNYFRKDSNEQDFNIDFMVACMQFINIIVHSTQNMNFRVHLQYEFTQLGLDEYLENKLRFNESDRLQVQIQAYLDNQFDVQQLLEDADAKNETLIEMEKIKEELSIEKEKFNKAQDDALNKISELQHELGQVRGKFETLMKEKDDMTVTIDTLKRNTLKAQQQMSLSSANNSNNISNSPLISSTGAPPPPPPPPAPFLNIPGPGSTGSAPPPPPPPPPPMMGGFNLSGSKLGGPGGMPPPPPGMGQPPIPSMTIKKKIETKYRLPNLNWVALKPQQVKGTVFCELDDEKLMSIIDFDLFEELFKTGNGQKVVLKNDSPSTMKKMIKKNENLTLLEAQRQRNLAISRRKIEMNINDVVKSINNLDLISLPIEQIDILLHFIPTDVEHKAFTKYLDQGKNIKNLSEEDQFLFALSKVERLQQKLNIMSFIANFNDTYRNLLPQINAVSSASYSIKQSKKLKKILEVVLAFGNYMNSSKRGPVYGFKLQSLESLLETKTADKKQTLLNFIVQTINDRFKDIKNFDSELTFIDKAAAVSLENVQFDMSELSKGMISTRKEHDLRMQSQNMDSQLLKNFLGKAESQFSELNNKYKNSQEQFQQCVEYFGETPRSQSPSSFFTIFVKFLKAFNASRIENEQRIKAQELETKNQEQASNNSKNPSPQNSLQRNQNAQRKNSTNNDMINELKKRKTNNGSSQGSNPGDRRSRPQPKKEINIEDLIEEINRGYITADAERRKRQRTQEIKKDYLTPKTSTNLII